MTTPHPTPEERVEAALKEWRKDAGDLRVHFARAIREAEAAGEARGRAMEREQMRTEALKVLSHVSDDDVENGRVFDRVDAALRARTNKESSNG
jgi:hypothetical protein